MRIQTVLESYSIVYHSPIKLRQGETISIEKWEPQDSEWAGWAFCIDARGIKGWVSQNYLKVNGALALVLRDYDATELAVSAGEAVEVIHEELGWAWVKNSQAQQGWVPSKNLSSSSKTNFEIRDGFNSEWLSALMDLHNKTEMKRDNAEQVGKAFHSSFAVVTAWQGSRLIACGRMISDGHMYSGIFDVVVDPEFQKQGVGQAIMKKLIAKAPATCTHLTSTFGNEGFYHKLGFRKHKTAMALYPEKMAASAYLDQNWEPPA